MCPSPVWLGRPMPSSTGFNILKDLPWCYDDKCTIQGNEGEVGARFEASCPEPQGQKQQEQLLKTSH
eukprot:2406343-Ditylum_brightwellii.AAC.1